MKYSVELIKHPLISDQSCSGDSVIQPTAYRLGYTV